MQLRFTEWALLRRQVPLNLWITCLVIALMTGTSGIDAQQPGSLTRPVAGSVIGKDPRFATVSVLSLASPEESVQAGVKEGLWVEQGFGDIALAHTGRRYFTQALGSPTYSITLVQPARRQVVEVIGIANAPTGRNLKEVSFRWRYVGLPEVVARYTGQGQVPHESKALVRPSDKGWRVEQLMLSESARVKFAGLPSGVLRREANDTERFLNRLQPSTRPSQQLGTFTWPSHQVAITDVGFRLENSAGVSCYWFGQVDRIQLERGPDGPKARIRGITAWRRDNLRPITMSAAEAELGDFATLGRSLASAHQAWAAKYADVVVRLKSASQTANFADVAKRGRQSWYNEETKTVACDEGLMPRTAAQLPPGLKIGSKWIGSMDSGVGVQVSGAAELQFTSVSGATIIYNGIRETLEMQVGNDGEIILRGVAYEVLSGVDRVFKLDTFRGRLSADPQSISGTWADAGTASGRWSVSLLRDGVVSENSVGGLSLVHTADFRRST